MTRARWLLPALALMVATAAALRGQAQSNRRPTVVAELDGIIHPIAAEYLSGVIDDADTLNAELVVVVLRTPGGLLESTRTIVSRIISSRAPVVVFVGPSGAPAASAGFLLTLAADVAAMAPGAHGLRCPNASRPGGLGLFCVVGEGVGQDFQRDVTIEFCDLGRETCETPVPIPPRPRTAVTS